MKSEDGVNLKNGHIVMTDCLVAGGASDGGAGQFSDAQGRRACGQHRLGKRGRGGPKEVRSPLDIGATQCAEALSIHGKHLYAHPGVTKR